MLTFFLASLVTTLFTFFLFVFCNNLFFNYYFSNTLVVLANLTSTAVFQSTFKFSYFSKLSASTFQPSVSVFLLSLLASLALRFSLQPWRQHNHRYCCISNVKLARCFKTRLLSLKTEGYQNVETVLTEAWTFFQNVFKLGESPKT